MNRAAAALLMAVAAFAPRIAVADEKSTWHCSLAVGGDLLATAAGGNRLRLSASTELGFPSWRKFSVLAAARAIILDDALLTAGFGYQAAASRPRLALGFFVEAGVAVRATAPVIGGGLRITSTFIGPVGAVIDLGGHLIVDGISNTSLVLALSVKLALAR